MKAKLYFYSTRNIVGTALAIGAAGLTLAGVVQDYWYLIVAGAYASGAMLTPSSAEMDVGLERQMDDEDIVAGLKQMSAEARKLLPDGVAADVVEICAMLAQAIPAMTRMGASGSTGYDLRTTATQYLPETINRYLRMPPAFRAAGRTADGQTPTQMLAEQIGILKQGLQGMMADVAASDAGGMAENGRFLKDRFAKPEFAGIS